MATPPRLAALKETDLQIKDGPVAGAGLREAFRRLFASLNPYVEGINKLVSKGITLSENVRCDVVTGTFTHGVAQQVQLRTLARAGSVLVLGADGQLPMLATVAMVQQTTQAKPLASVTVWFNNSSAASVKCALLLLPEGQQTSTTPAFLEAIAKSVLTTTGDIIYASAAKTPARLGVGAADTYLRSPDGTSAPSYFSNPMAAANAGVSAQSIPTGATENIVVFGTVERDTDGAYNNITGRYTIPAGKGGDYEITGCVTYGTAPGGTCTCSIYKAGSVIKTFQAIAPAAFQTIGCTALLNLAAGDIIDIRTKHGNVGAQSLGASGLDNYVALKRLG